MDMPPSGYIPNYPASSPMEVRPTQDTVLSLKERKTLSKVMKLKRSMSTPNVRPQQQQVAPPLPTTPQGAASAGDPSGAVASGDKRRNKLGYHRTSVACDVQGRCVNCIRLKKECSFYPVDQQPPAAAASKAVSHSSAGPKIGSATSSPAMQHPVDPYQTINMPPIQTMPPPMKPQGPEGYAGDGKYANPSTSKAGDINTSWRGYPNESPISQQFSPYAPHALPQSATWGTPVGPEAGNHEDMAWSSYPPPPGRSMSFGGEPAQYQGRGYDRKSSTMSAHMYPTPIATSNMPSMETIPGTTLEQHVSLSAGAVAPAYAPWQQPSYSYTKPGDPYGGWYENGGNPPLGSDDGVAPGSESQVPGTGMYHYTADR
ncbi:uncharacterized protein MKZ38_005632 [Zalerion maritima]|uniref:Zn(2)-C6 fungal-type domain-containing protein n=1 Tax=Zalerion maritima TaxID=339359 RepID=A0AAD5RXT2_9PEZI|nr:uncharacterized protein MKZ38_005632 [Zalerion maritima]